MGCCCSLAEPIIFSLNHDFFLLSLLRCPIVSQSKMTVRRRLAAINEKIRLHGDDEKHEQTDAWSNRDLIPLPPERRTWGWFNFFGFWSIASLNLANWQTPSTFLGTMVVQVVTFDVDG